MLLKNTAYTGIPKNDNNQIDLNKLALLRELKIFYEEEKTKHKIDKISAETFIDGVPAQLYYSERVLRIILGDHDVSKAITAILNMEVPLDDISCSVKRRSIDILAQEKNDIDYLLGIIREFENENPTDLFCNILCRLSMFKDRIMIIK